MENNNLPEEIIYRILLEGEANEKIRLLSKRWRDERMNCNREFIEYQSRVNLTFNEISIYIRETKNIVGIYVQGGTREQNRQFIYPNEYEFVSFFMVIYPRKRELVIHWVTRNYFETKCSTSTLKFRNIKELLGRVGYELRFQDSMDFKPYIVDPLTLRDIITKRLTICWKYDVPSLETVINNSQKSNNDVNYTIFDLYYIMTSLLLGKLSIEELNNMRGNKYTGFIEKQVTLVRNYLKSERKRVAMLSLNRFIEEMGVSEDIASRI